MRVSQRGFTQVSGHPSWEKRDEGILNGIRFLFVLGGYYSTFYELFYVVHIDYKQYNLRMI